MATTQRTQKNVSPERTTHTDRTIYGELYTYFRCEGCGAEWTDARDRCENCR